MQDLLEVLSREGDTDFVMGSKQTSVWITVDDVSVNIRRTTEGGVKVSLYPAGDEMADPLDECGATRLSTRRWRTGV